MTRLVKRLDSAHLIALAALFVALGSTAWAVSAQKVGTKQLKRNAVTSTKIRNGAVKTAKLAPNAVDSSRIADGAIATSDIGGAAVKSDNIAGNAVNAAILADNSVRSEAIIDGSVRAADLGQITAVQVTTSNIAVGTDGVAVAPCPAGTVVISGGGATGSSGFDLHSTQPAENGWAVEAKNTSAQPDSLTAVAYCLQG